MEAATAEKTTTLHPSSPKSKLPSDVPIHHPTPVDEFRSPTKAVDARAPSAGNLDPRSHHHPDNNSSLSSPLTRDWNRSTSAVADLLTPTHSTSPFQRDVKYVPPPPPIDVGYTDNQPPNPPLPPYPYNGLAGGFETGLNHGPFLTPDRVCPPGQDYTGSRYDNHRERLDKSKQHFSGHGRGDHFRGKRDNTWEPRHNGQQRWESGWSRPPHSSNSNGRKKHTDYSNETPSSLGSYHETEDREISGDGWDRHRYDGGATNPFDPAAGHGEAAQFLPANLDTPSFAEPEEEEHAKPPQSLESRIQAMLQGSLPFMQLQTEEESDASEGPGKNASISSSTPPNNSCTTPPPLPPPESEPPPPLPPLPMEDDPPPLPPEPTLGNPSDGFFPSGENSESQECGANIGLDTTVDLETNGVAVCEGNNDDDDDRMSLSSLSSGGEKLEVIELNVEVPGCSMSWMMNPMMQNNFRNNELNQQMFVGSGCGMGGPMMGFMSTREEERREEPEFQVVLDEVISELKLIMGKDMRKKMVESTAFKSFESWWQTSEAQEKVLGYHVFPLVSLHTFILTLLSYKQIIILIIFLKRNVGQMGA